MLLGSNLVFHRSRRHFRCGIARMGLAPCAGMGWNETVQHRNEARDEAAFVGRAASVGELHRMLDAAIAGHGAVVLVRGEAGIGKTRLVEHTLSSANDQTAVVLWGRCREAGAPPLWPWSQIAREARRAGEAGFAVVGDADQSDWDPVAPNSSGHDRFERLDGMVQALIGMASTTPLAVVIDDLQWADDDSIELLSFLAADVIRSRLLVVATVRTGESGRPTDGPLDSLLADAHRPVVIDLSGLESDDLTDLLTATLGAQPAPELVEAASSHTGGNPFFVTEVARLLRSSGRGQDASSWRGVLPEGPRSVVGRRFARLPQHSHAALRAAAVLGNEFDATVLAAVMDLDRSEAMDRLDAAVAAGLVNSIGDGRCRFAHALIREAAIAEVGGRERRDLHRRASEVLVALVGERAAAEIADHVINAGDNVEGARWCVVAAHRASASAMYADAANWLDRSLRLEDPSRNDLARAELLIDFATAAERAGRHQDSGAAYGEALLIAKASDDASIFGRAALGIGTLGGGFEVRILDVEQTALLENALDRMPTEDSALRSWLLARLSVALSLTEAHGRRVTLAGDALAMARRLGDDAALAHTLGASCDTHAGPWHLNERLKLSSEMLGAAARSGDPELELLARRFRIVALMEDGNVAASAREIAAFVSLAERLRQPQFLWYAHTLLGMLAHLSGDLDEALRLGRLAADEGRQAGSANAQMLADGGLITMTLRDQGDYDAMRIVFRTATNHHPEANRGIDPTALFLIDAVPDAAEVALVLDSLTIDAMPSRDDAIYLHVAVHRLVGAAFLGRTAEVGELTATLEPLSDVFVLDGHAALCYGPVSLFLGKAFALLGDHVEARRHLEDALIRIVPINATLLEADVRARLAALSNDVDSAEHPRRGSDPRTGDFVRDGEVWSVAFSGRQARFHDAKGMRDIAVLLACPRQHVHCFDLVNEGGNALARPTDLGPALDARARRGYEERIRELSEDIEEADTNNDLARVERLESERDVLLHELSIALGLGGRDRKAGPDPVERARKAVGMRIRGAIDKIERDLPDLGRHLRHSVRTGMYCSYEPEHDVTWRL